jgi:hypothetical protein
MVGLHRCGPDPGAFNLSGRKIGVMRLRENRRSEAESGITTSLTWIPIGLGPRLGRGSLQDDVIWREWWRDHMPWSEGLSGRNPW